MQNNSLINLKLIRKKLSNKQLRIIYDIIKYENNYTIISKLDFDVFIKFMNLIICSNKILLFLLRYNNQIIGYSIYSKKPKYLFSEIKSLKTTILFNLLKNFYFFDILNLMIKLTGVLNIFQNKKKKNILSNNFNLSYLAITQNFQSKGLGKYFIKETIAYIKKNFFTKYISTEAKNLKTINFYKKKCRFQLYSLKLELFKVHKILIKKL